MISINTNPAASAAAYSLDNVSRNLQKTLTRLSSGSRIVSPMDDAGGLAVAMRLNAAVRRTEATQSNVSNAQAFLETQDGVLKSAEKVINRLGELTQLGTDVTKSTSDLALYQTEVNSLKSQILSLMSESFNGVSLFTNGGSATSINTVNGTVSITASQDGSQTINITKSDLGNLGLILGTNAASGLQISASISVAVSAITSINAAIQSIATLRANNGAEQSRWRFAADALPPADKTNLESASSRITEARYCRGSAKSARFTILQQAGTAMLARSQSVHRIASAPAWHKGTSLENPNFVWRESGPRRAKEGVQKWMCEIGGNFYDRKIFLISISSVESNCLDFNSEVK
jgi:flagellin